MNACIVRVAHEHDVAEARHVAREVSSHLAFDEFEIALIVTSVSEIAQNIVEHAGRGEVHIAHVERDGKTGIAVVAIDDGPGIPSIAAALTDGFSTGKGLGLGLSGAQRMMDELTVESQPGLGTTIRMARWCAKAAP